MTLVVELTKKSTSLLMLLSRTQKIYPVIKLYWLCSWYCIWQKKKKSSIWHFYNWKSCFWHLCIISQREFFLWIFQLVGKLGSDTRSTWNSTLEQIGLRVLLKTPTVGCAGAWTVDPLIRFSDQTPAIFWPLNFWRVNACVLVGWYNGTQ